jgi:hypothetical protein
LPSATEKSEPATWIAGHLAVALRVGFCPSLAQIETKRRDVSSWRCGASEPVPDRAQLSATNARAAPMGTGEVATQRETLPDNVRWQEV